MVAILSATDNPLYSFFIPITTWSWNRLGIKTCVFIPKQEYSNSFKLAIDETSIINHFYPFEAEPKRIPTYSQVSRLFGSCIDEYKEEYLITGDIDLAVFSDLFSKADLNAINIYGEDLTNYTEFPLSFIGMPYSKWEQIFNTKGRTAQECVSELIDPIEGENIRGEQWSYDQWYATKKIKESGIEYNSHLRSKSNTNRTARNRADRDGWQYDVNGLVDAHLPRPGYEAENFNKILKLFKEVYPQENFDWMSDYRNLFVSLL